MAGRYKLTNPLEVARERRKTKETAVKAPTEETKPTSGDEQYTGGGEINGRPIFEPLKDKEVMQAIGLVRQYLRDTGVNANMNKFTTALLQSRVLPYNPYPGYVRRFLKICEKFHTKRETLIAVQRRISLCPTFVTGTGILSGVKLPDAKLWGLQHILMMVNPKILNVYRSIVKSATVSQAKVTEKCGEGVSIMTTINGPCIFSGSVHDKCFKLNLCVTVLARGTDFQDTAKLLGKMVLCDLTYIMNDSDHHILSLEVPVLSGNILQKRSWSLEELQSVLSSETSPTKDGLIQTIGFAALKKQDAIVHLILNCGKDGDAVKMKYVKAEKSFNLMTLMVQSQTSIGQPPVLYISTAPYQALHEGIFVEQSEAELYLTTFRKYSNSKAPLSQAVSTAVQKVWQERSAGRMLESDAMFILHYQFLMERIQNQTKPTTAKNEDSLAIEICRILQGLGAKLERIAVLLTTLYDIVRSKLLLSYPDLFSEVFSICRSCLTEYFDEAAHELTASFAKPVVIRTLSEIETLIKDKNFHEIQSLLNFLKGYLKSLSISLMDDALDGFPIIRNTQAQVDNIQQVEFGKDLNIDVRPNAFRHKSEATTYGDIDRKQVDLSVSSTNVAAPPQISQHAARMQYCMDIRLDEVWKDFMYNMLIIRKNLPPNPYPHLISMLRQASLKVQLFREDLSVTVRKLLASKPRPYDEKLGLYAIPGISAFGKYCAVASLSSVGFRQVSAMASSVAISSPHPSGGIPAIAAGAFEIKCLMAVSNDALFYSSASPYLTDITTDEYCFIKGPSTQEHDGILSLSKVLLIYLGNLQAQGILTLRASFSVVEMDLTDLNGISTRFQNQFTATLNAQKSVVLHLLMPLDWRYVYIKKVIHVRYVNEMSDNVKFITEHDQAAQYRQVFLNANDAIEYTKRIQIYKTLGNKLLEEKIAESHGNYDWQSVAQLTFAYALENGSTGNMDKTVMEIAAFCWRLLHSPCGALIHSMALNFALSEGVRYAGNADRKNDALKTMLVGYRNFLNSVLTVQSTLASKAINPYCQDLLQKVAPCNLTVGTVNMGDGGKLHSILLHVRSVTQALADSIAIDLVHCTPAIQSLLNKNKRPV